MKKHQVLLLIGGLLLMIGAALPWATVSTSFMGLSKSMNGLEGDGIFSALGGLILLIISLAAKGRPGKSYSMPAMIIAILCGLLLAAKIYSVLTMTVAASVEVSIGMGLLFVSPLGAILGYIGGAWVMPALLEQPAE